MSKVVVIGATGNSGSRIVDELIARGHAVTAVSRTAAEKFAGKAGVAAADNDLSDVKALEKIVEGSDVVVHAYAPPTTDTDQLIGVTERIVEAISLAGGKNGGPRLLVVGGAGGLNVAPGVTLHESGYLPAEYLPISASHIKVYKALLQNNTVNWTYFAPAGFFQPGERTGTFRLGKDDLIMGADGKSSISMEDYAIAAVDEIEQPKHLNERFTIGY